MHRPSAAWCACAVLGAATVLTTAACAELTGDRAGAPPTAAATSPTLSSSSSPSPSPSPSSSSSPLSADLTIAVDQSGQGAVTTFTLTCDPPGGDHPDPEAACDALAAAGGAAAMAPVPRDRVCTEIYGGPQTAVVEGTVDGKAVRATFARTDGCEISRWDALAPLLGTPGGV